MSPWNSSRGHSGWACWFPFRTQGSLGRKSPECVPGGPHQPLWGAAGCPAASHPGYQVRHRPGRWCLEPSWPHSPASPRVCGLLWLLTLQPADDGGQSQGPGVVRAVRSGPLCSAPVSRLRGSLVPGGLGTQGCGQGALNPSLGPPRTLSELQSFPEPPLPLLGCSWELAEEGRLETAELGHRGRRGQAHSSVPKGPSFLSISSFFFSFWSF